MDRFLQIGHIHIVEWLPVGDARTGRELFDEIEPLGIVSQPRVAVSLQQVQSRTEFLAYLQFVREECQRTRQVPLLHIETHGFEDGIGASADEEILWPELRRELTPLNQLTALRLFVVVAACEGIWGLTMAQPTERAPFLALLGPDRTISAGELARRVLVFYRHLLRDRDGSEAIRSMNEAARSGDPLFGIVNAEMLFRDVFTAYLRDECSEQAIDARVERVVRETIRRFREAKGVGMWAHEIERIRKIARQEALDHERHFDDKRRHYFFIDLFLENDQRFPIRFRDCMS